MSARLHGVNAGGFAATPIDGDKVLIVNADGYREWLDVGPLLRQRDAAAAARPSFPPTVTRAEWEKMTPQARMDVAHAAGRGETKIVD